MKNPFRRNRPVQLQIQSLTAADVMSLSAQPQIPPDVVVAIAKALEPYPLDRSSAARFFGVPMGMFSKDELIRIVSWVGETARDKRRDS